MVLESFFILNPATFLFTKTLLVFPICISILLIKLIIKSSGKTHVPGIHLVCARRAQKGCRGKEKYIKQSVLLFKIHNFVDFT